MVLLARDADSQNPKTSFFFCKYVLVVTVDMMETAAWLGERADDTAALQPANGLRNHSKTNCKKARRQRVSNMAQENRNNDSNGYYNKCGKQ